LKLLGGIEICGSHLEDLRAGSVSGRFGYSLIPPG